MMEKIQTSQVYLDWVNHATRHFEDGRKYQSTFDLFNNDEFKLFFRNAPSVVMVINHIDHVYEFFSENCKQILGFEAEDFYKGKVEFGVSRVYPEHSKIISNFILPSIFNTIDSYKDKIDVKKIKISFNFKYQRKDGQYIWVSEHMTVLETDEQGNPLLSVFFLSDIDKLKKDDQVDFSVSILNLKGYFEPIKIINFPDNNSFELSNREMEILSFIGRGLSSDSIAQKLSISPHTVKTHRRNMLDKTGAQNTTELLRIMTIKGLL